MNIHHLKTLQPWFDYVVSGKKTFEVRKNDRDFRAGDILILHEHLISLSPDRTERTEREAAVLVDMVLYDEDVKGIQPGYCVMGISKIENSPGSK